MKKIDIKARMEEKVRSTEWTDSNTWNVLDRIRKAKSAPRFRWAPALLPAAAVLVLVVCLGVTSVFGPKGGPDQIRNQNLHTLQPVTTSLSQGDGQDGEGPASPDTVLYYNPDGGSKYHLDPNCLSVLPKYQPLEGQFTYAEVNDEQFSSLEPCRICNAPERNPDTAGDLPAQDSAGQAEPEAGTVTMGQVDEAVAEATRQALRDKYPGWAEQLIPLNVSCENQGIRMEVLGALVKGNDSTLLCALQDLEGDRINESTVDSQYEDRDNLGTIQSYGHNPISYDPETHRLIYLNQKEYRQMDKPADGIYRLSMDTLSSTKKETRDLAPLLAQYGKSVEGIRPPEDVKTYSTDPLPEDLRVLDYTDPLNISLNERGNILLTGIGWINGQLHVQTMETGIPRTDSYSYIYSLSCKAGNDSIFREQKLYWNIDEPGLQGEMEEYIFNVGADKSDQMEMPAGITNYTSQVTGPWEIRFPLSPVSVEGINFGDFDEVEDLLQPLNLADEKQGFRMEVHSAYAEKDTLWITYSLRNLDGNHVLDKDSDCPDLVCSVVPVAAVNTVHYRDYNEEEQKLICKSCIQYRAQFPEENQPVTVRFDLRPVIKENISFSFSFMLDSIRRAADGSSAPVSVPDAAEGDPSDSAYAQVILDSIKKQLPQIADKLQPVNLSREDQGIRLDVHYIAWADNQEYIIYSLQDLEDGRDGEMNVNTAFDCIRYTDGYAHIFNQLCENEYNNQKTYFNACRTLHEYPDRDPVETYPSAINLDYVLISKWLSLDVTPQVKENAAAVEGIESPELLTDSLVRGEDDIWREPGNNKTKVLDYTHPLDLPLYKTVSLTGAGWIDGKLHVQAHNKDTELLSITGHHRVELSDASLFIQYDDMHNGTLVWDDNGDQYPEWYEYTFSVSPEDLQQNHNLYLYFNEYTDCLQGDWTIPLPRPENLPETESVPVSAPVAEKPVSEETALTQSILNSIQYDYPEIMDKLQPVNLSREDRGIRLDVHYIAWADNQEYVIYSLQDLEENRDGEMEAAGFGNIRYTGCTEGQVKRSSRYHTPGFNNIPGYNDHPIYVQVLSTLRKNPDGTSVEAYPSAINLDHIAISKSQTLNVLPMVKEYAAAVEGMESPKLLPSSNLLDPSSSETSHIWTNYPQEKATVLDYTRPLNIPLYGTVSLTGAGWIDGKLHVQTHNEDTDLCSVSGRHRMELSDSADLQTHSHNCQLKWGDNDDDAPEWREYIFDVSPEDLEQADYLHLYVTEYTDYLQGDWTIPLPRPEGAPETESSPAAEEPVPAETLSAAVSLEESARQQLHELYPEIADELKPVNLSREYQGIQVDLLSALAKGNQSWIVFSVQDSGSILDFNNSTHTISFNGHDDIAPADRVVQPPRCLAFDEAARKGIYIYGLQYKEDIQPVDRYVTLDITGFNNLDLNTIDLIPLLEEHGGIPEITSTMPLPQVRQQTDITEVLDYTQPLDIPLANGVVLTGFGWIDGKLHIQLHDTVAETIGTDSSDIIGRSIFSAARLKNQQDNPELKYLTWDVYAHANAAWNEFVLDISPENDISMLEAAAQVNDIVLATKGSWQFALSLSSILVEAESSPAAEEPVPEETPIPQQNISRAESPDGMFPINLSGENQGIRFELIAGKVDNDSATFRLAVEDLEGRYSSLQLDPSFRFDNIATFHDAAYSPTDDKDSEHRKLFDISPKFEEPVDPAPRDITARIDSLLIEDKASIDVSSLLEQYGQSAEGIAPPKAVRTYYNRSVAIPEDLKVLDYTNPLNIPLLEDVYLTGIGWINGQLHIQLHNTNPAHITRGSTDYTKWHVYISGAEYPDYAPVKWSEDGSDDAAWVECILDTAPETVSMDKPVLFLTVVRDVLKDDAWSITVPLDSVWAGSTETAEIREEPASAADIADTADSVPADTPDAIPAGYNNIVNAKNQLLRFFCDWAQGDMDSLVGETTVAWRLATEDHAAALAKLTAGVPLSFQVNSLASDPGSSDQVTDCVVKMDPLDGSEPRYERIQIRLRNEEDDSHYEVVPESLAAREPAQPLPDKETVPLSEEAITNFNLDTYFSGVRDNLIPVNLSQEAQGIRMTVISALVKEQESWIVYSLEDLEGRYSGCDFYHDSLDTRDIGNFKSFSSFPLYSSARQHKAVLMDHVRFDSAVDTSDRVIHIRKGSLRNYKSRFMDFAPLIAQYAVTTEGVDRPAGNGYVNPEADIPKVLDWSNSLNIPVTEDGFLSAIGWIDGRLHIQFRTTNTFSFHNAMFTEYNGGKAETKYWNDGNTRVYWRDGSTQFIEHVINYQPADPENTHLEGCLDYTEDLLPRLNLTVEVPLSSILAD